LPSLALQADVLLRLRRQRLEPAGVDTPLPPSYSSPDTLEHVSQCTTLLPSGH